LSKPKITPMLRDAMGKIGPDSVDLLLKCETDDDLLALASTTFEVGRAIAVQVLGPRAAAEWLRKIAYLMENGAQ
jgi:hypothetical protein